MGPLFDSGTNKYCRMCNKDHIFSEEFWRYETYRNSYSCRQHYNNCKRAISEGDKLKKNSKQREFRKNNREKSAEYNKTRRVLPSVRFSTLGTNAIKRGLEVRLSIQEFTELVEQNCTYCGTAPYGVGCWLDRKDNELGYNKDNCVPCCGRCNVTRQDFYSFEEFRDYIAPAIRQIDLLRSK